MKIAFWELGWIDRDCSFFFVLVQVMNHGPQVYSLMSHFLLRLEFAIGITLMDWPSSFSYSYGPCIFSSRAEFRWWHDWIVGWGSDTGGQIWILESQTRFGRHYLGVVCYMCSN